MKKHALKCWLWKGLWGVSLLSLVTVLLSVKEILPEAMRVDPLLWLWMSMITGVLAIPVKLDCQSCEACSVPRV